MLRTSEAGLLDEIGLWAIMQCAVVADSSTTGACMPSVIRMTYGEKVGAQVQLAVSPSGLVARGLRISWCCQIDAVNLPVMTVQRRCKRSPKGTYICPCCSGSLSVMVGS